MVCKAVVRDELQRFGYKRDERITLNLCLLMSVRRNRVGPMTDLHDLGATTQYYFGNRTRPGRTREQNQIPRTKVRKALIYIQ